MIVINIDDDVVKVFKSSNGVLEESPVEIAPYDFSFIFSELIEENRQYVLPYGCVKSYYNKNKASFLIESPSQKKQIATTVYRNGARFDIVTPKMYFLCNGSLDKKTGSFSLFNSHYFISPDDFSDLDTSNKNYVYGLFSNYNPTYSRGICLGPTDQSFFSTCSLSHLSAFPRVFFGSNFNTDLLVSPSRDFSPYIKNIFESDPSFRNYLCTKLNIDEKLHDDYLVGDRHQSAFCYLEYFSEKYNSFPYSILPFYTKHGKSIDEYTSEDLF